MNKVDIIRLSVKIYMINRDYLFKAIRIARDDLIILRMIQEDEQEMHVRSEEQNIDEPKGFPESTYSDMVH